MSDNINSPDFVEPDVTNSDEALILQRSGEEFMLEKALYRFTMRPNANFLREQLSQIHGCVWRRTISQAKLELYTVFPEQLETVMSQVRADKNVDFVSHVYKLENNPGTLVYLSDQIT
ncbi:MAG: peptidase S8, partial [Dolichospermum sp.]